MNAQRLLQLYAFLLVLALSGAAQDRFRGPSRGDYPSIRKSGRAIADHVPKGFEIVKSVEGDLNGDGISDAAVHIIGTQEKFVKKSDCGLTWNLNPRILFIVFGDRDRNYRLVKQSNTFILAPYSFSHSEPLTDISISNGVLKLDFELWQSMGSWSATESSYKFRFQDGDFKLIGADRRDYQRNSSDESIESYNFITRRVKLLEKSRADDKVLSETWRRFPSSRLRTFDTFSAPFTWKVTRHTYL